MEKYEQEDYDYLDQECFETLITKSEAWTLTKTYNHTLSTNDQTEDFENPTDFFSANMPGLAKFIK